MIEEFIKTKSTISSIQLSISDYQSAIDKYKDIQNEMIQTSLIFGTDAGGTTYEYYKSNNNNIHLIVRYKGKPISHFLVETNWIESMESYLQTLNYEGLKWHACNFDY
jgi:hypothetical protein